MNAAVAVASAAPPAHACSCMPGEVPGFVSDGVIPSNARGVLWSSDEAVSAADFEILGRRAGADWARVDAALGSPAGTDRAPASGSHVAVGPAAPMHPGDLYVVRAKTRERVRRREARITVSDRPLDLRQAAIGVTVSAIREGPLKTAAAMSCSRTVRAAHASVRLELPPPLESFREHLIVTTLVNGRGWRYSDSLCSWTPPARSSVDTLYTDCVLASEWSRLTPVERQRASLEYGLPPGPHRVAMRVVFAAGAADQVLVTSEQDIDLRCRTTSE